MAGPFKMKGNPMQRNFGIGRSPMQKLTAWEKIKAAGKGVWSGVKGAIEHGNYAPMTEAAEYGWKKGKRTRIKALKEYNKD